MQRQLALQRLQEQEREMQMRLEQQKHMTQIRQMQNYGYPQAQVLHMIYILNYNKVCTLWDSEFGLAKVTCDSTDSLTICMNSRY